MICFMVNTDAKTLPNFGDLNMVSVSFLPNFYLTPENSTQCYFVSIHHLSIFLTTQYQTNTF